MTERQRRFFELATDVDNVTTLVDAYRKAGYKGKGGSAYASASRLAKTLKVREAWDKAFEKRRKEAQKKFMAELEQGINIDRVWERALRGKK